MLFNSWTFAGFLLIVLGLYQALGRWHRVQNLMLLAASYVFYGWWDWRFLSLILISTLIDYCVGQRLAVTQSPRARKWLVAVSVCGNLGILGFFKYFNFFVESAAGVISAFGLEPHLPTLYVILPVGISFYTFQTMGYTIDVYRRRIEPMRNPLTFAIYVAYFPQLVAGPIERAERLLGQIDKPRRVTSEQFGSGVLLILIGLVRKVAIADAVAPEVDAAFASPEELSGAMLLRAVLLFSLQIYGDFAGYTDIARGTSRLLGIELMENFKHPYFATNITAFWRRWHVSLSTWLRDYLYIPLGGNRGSRWFVYRNLMIVMLLGGLWHGAAWTFVVWGLIHGTALVAHKAWMDWRGTDGTERSPRDPLDACWIALSWMVTMLVVALSWVFFRADSFADAFVILERIVTLEGGLAGVGRRELAMPMLMLAVLLVIDVPQRWRRDHTVALAWPIPLRGVYYAGLILAVVLLRVEGDVPFIYFQF